MRHSITATGAAAPTATASAVQLSLLLVIVADKLVLFCRRCHKAEVFVARQVEHQ
jgi:hypothetical protein